MKKLALFLATIFCVVFISAPLLAHHGEANYDTEKTVSVKGTVTDFRIRQSPRANHPRSEK